MRKVKLLLAVLAMTFSMGITSFAGEWSRDDAGWYYQNDDGSRLINQWFQDFDGKWYYLNETGYMLTDQAAPDGRAVGADGAWIEPVTGDVKSVLFEIGNWLTGDVWNYGYCDFSSYEYEGKDSVGKSIDIDTSLQSFKENYKKKAGYASYINALPDEYASLKDAWNKLSGESDKLYKYYEAGVIQTGKSADTAIFKQYHRLFSACVSDIK